MKYYSIGKLIVSDIRIRHDIIFGVQPAKHLFWCFWWKV